MAYSSALLLRVDINPTFVSVVREQVVGRAVVATEVTVFALKEAVAAVNMVGVAPPLPIVVAAAAQVVGRVEVAIEAMGFALLEANAAANMVGVAPPLPIVVVVVELPYS